MNFKLWEVWELYYSQRIENNNEIWFNVEYQGSMV